MDGERGVLATCLGLCLSGMPALWGLVEVCRFQASLRTLAWLLLLLFLSCQACAGAGVLDGAKAQAPNTRHPKPQGVHKRVCVLSLLDAVSACTKLPRIPTCLMYHAGGFLWVMLRKKDETKKGDKFKGLWPGLRNFLDGYDRISHTVSCSRCSVKCWVSLIARYVVLARDVSVVAWSSYHSSCCAAYILDHRRRHVRVHPLQTKLRPC